MRGEFAYRDKDLDGRADRLEGVCVGDVQLGAPAECARVFLEGGLEVAGTENDAGEARVGEPRDKRRGVQPRGAEVLERAESSRVPRRWLVPSSRTMPG